MTTASTSVLPGRLAAAPISWGVCEVPGWGLQLTPERVLGEMAELGITATELGALGWLPADGAEARQVLDRHGLTLVGGFVPVVVHERELSPAMIEHARSAADQLAKAGGDIFVAAAVQDLDWSAPVPLDAEGWKRAGEQLDALAAIAEERGLTFVLHPHAGTVLESERDVAFALEQTNVLWCLDTGHLALGGVDPACFVRDHGERVGHVHFKDVDERVAARLRSGELSLVQAVQHGVFTPLGSGDVRIAAVVSRLRDSGYDRWLVLEQDLAIAGGEPPTNGGPAAEVRKSIDFLAGLASEESSAARG